MLIEEGTVVAVEEDGLWVETMKQSACEKCSAKAGCGQRLLNSSGGTKMSKIKAYFSSSGVSHSASDTTSKIWVAGDRVEIGIEEQALVTATLLAYMVPLLMMVVVAYLASLVSSADSVTVTGAVIGLLAGGAYSRWYAQNHKSDCRFHAVVLGASSLSR